MDRLEQTESMGDMKSFYMGTAIGDSGFASTLHMPAREREALGTHITTRARVAVYEAAGAAPRVEDIEPAPVGEFIESFTTRVYELAREQGGSVPYTAIREVTENFIHANFAEPVVSVLDGGATIRFADQGPGISDKERAVMPGFTTASGDMKCFIRGVGSGLPIVRDYLSVSGGSLIIEDNLGGGSVVTLYSRRTRESGAPSLQRSELQPAAPAMGTGRSPGRSRPGWPDRTGQPAASPVHSSEAGLGTGDGVRLGGAKPGRQGARLRRLNRLQGPRFTGGSWPHLLRRREANADRSGPQLL